MIRTFTYAFFLVLLIAFTGNLSAQSPATTRQIFYVQATDLTIENYATLRTRLSTDGRFEIKEACIPAHVVSVEVLSGYEMDMAKAYTDFTSLANETHVMHLSRLPEFNDEKFLNTCKNSRTGN